MNLAQQLQSKATVLLVLTHFISSTFSTFGSIMLEGRVLDCKSTSRSSSARPLDTEFILTHFSAWPKSNSSRVLTTVSLASLYNIYEFRGTRKEKKKKKACFLLTEKRTEQKIWNNVRKKLDNQYIGVPKISVILGLLVKQSSPAPCNFIFLVSL